MIEIKDYSIAFGHRELLHECSAEFPNCRLSALIGRNGAGKSTLLRSIAGLENRYSGEILVEGRTISTMPAADRARHIAFVPTGRQRVAGITCRQAVELGRMPYTSWTGMLSSADSSAVDDAMELLGISRYGSRLLNTISDGEYQKVMIARAMAQDPQVLLLDEPTSFLDQPGRVELCMQLAELAHEMGKCVLFSTHEIDLVFELCDSIALVSPPRIILKQSEELAQSGLMEKYFTTENVTFDAQSRRIVSRGSL